MNLENIPQKSQKLMNQVTDAVEKTGKKVANQIANFTEGKAEEITKEAIQAAVSQGLDVLQVASKQVREKNINSERVTLQVGIEILNVVQLKMRTEVPEKDRLEDVDIELENT